MSDEQIKAILKLFKCYVDNSNDMTVSSNIKTGIVIEGTPNAIVTNYADELYGINGEQLNQTLHKSFKTVSDSTIEKLLVDQLFHYFSTYGLESLGITDDNYIYIPHEKLDIPELNEDLKFILIRRISAKELVEKILSLLKSNIALSKETIEDLKELSPFIPDNEFDNINNREFRLYLYDRYKKVPSDPDTFMRYLLYRITGQTLYIYNQYKYIAERFNYIRQKRPNYELMNSSLYSFETAYDLIDEYIVKFPDNGGYIKLASVFNRYKTVFMTLKYYKSKDSELAKKLNNIINIVQRYSKKYHVPIVNSFTNNIFSFKYEELPFTEKSYSYYRSRLDKLSVYRELRLMNYMRGMISDSGLDFYRIRNNKIFVRDKKSKKNFVTKMMQKYLYDFVYDHLLTRIQSNFRDKQFYIPDYLKIAVPTSEKKFIGNLPDKSYIELPRAKNLVVGIHWFDLDGNESDYANEHRVDLDLHASNKTKHIGWDGIYRTDDNGVLFSGDVTSAPRPNGASEYFLFRQNTDLDTYLLTLNNYRQVYDKNNELKYEFIIAETDEDIIGINYIVDPNKVLVKMDRKLYKDSSETCLGLVEINKDNMRFYFTCFDTGSNSRSRTDNEINKKIYQAFKDDLVKTIYVNDVIQDCNGSIVNVPYKEELKEVEINGKIYYEKAQSNVDKDLSLNSISKETVINLFKEDNK